MERLERFCNVSKTAAVEPFSKGARRGILSNESGPAAVFRYEITASFVFYSVIIINRHEDEMHLSSFVKEVTWCMYITWENLYCLTKAFSVPVQPCGQSFKLYLTYFEALLEGRMPPIINYRLWTVISLPKASLT